MNRFKDNLEILHILHLLIEKYPDQRFGQILSNYVIPLNMGDIFYPEGKEFIEYARKFI